MWMQPLQVLKQELAYQFTDAIQADISAMYAWGENTIIHHYRKLHH
jgi:hypothetical protein